MIAFPPCALAAQGGEVGFYHQSQFVRQRGETISESLDYVQGSLARGESHGIWGFISVARRYVSGTVGEYYDFKSVPLEVGLSLGAEYFAESRHDKYKLFSRFACTIRFGSLETDDGFIDLYYENGASKVGWYQANAMKQFGSSVWLGFMSQSDIGTGLRIRLKAPRIPLRLWVAPIMVGTGRTNSVVGAELLLK